MIVERWGFPFRCLGKWQYWEGWTGTIQSGKAGVDNAWNFAVPIGRSSYYGLSLPIAPLWFGFALNTICFAALAWGVWRGPSVIRRHRRRRAGWCVGCGYDLKGLAAGAVCPECGRGL